MRRLKRKETIPEPSPPVKRKQITVQSAKAKGRRLQQLVCEKISHLTGASWGSAGGDHPIESRGMGQSGTDVRLESHIKKLFPFSVECKAQETFAIPAWVEQAVKNQEAGTDWLLVCKRSKKDPIVVMDLDAFFRLLERLK